MEIRELKTRDIKTLAHMLGKLKQDHVYEISQLLNPNTKSDMAQVGLSVFRIVAADLTDDLYAWFADLCGMEIEQFDESGFSTVKDIITQLIERGDFKDFFAGAMQQAEIKIPSRESMTLYNTDMAGQTVS